MKTQNFLSFSFLQPNNFGLFTSETRRAFMAGAAAEASKDAVRKMFEQKVEGDQSNPDGKLDTIKIGEKTIAKADVKPADLTDAVKAIQKAAGETLRDVYQKTGMLDADKASAEVRIANFVNGVDLQARSAIDSVEKPNVDAYFQEFMKVFTKFENAYANPQAADVKNGLGLLEKGSGKVENIAAQRPSWFKQEWLVQVNAGTPSNFPDSQKSAGVQNAMHFTLGNETITCGRGFKDIQKIQDPKNPKNVIGFSILDGDGDMISVVEENGKLKRQFIDQSLYLTQAKREAGNIVNASDDKMRYFDKDNKINSQGTQEFFKSGLIVGALALGILSKISFGKDWGQNYKAPEASNAGAKPTTAEVKINVKLSAEDQKKVTDMFKNNKLEGQETVQARQDKIKKLAAAIKSTRPEKNPEAFDKAVKAEMPKFLGITGEGEKKMLAAKMEIKNGNVEFTFDKPTPQQPKQLTLKTNGDIELTVGKEGENVVTNLWNQSADAVKKGFNWIGGLLGDKPAETAPVTKPVEGKVTSFEEIKTELGKCGICFADVPVAIAKPVAAPAAPELDPAIPTPKSAEKPTAMPKKKPKKVPKKESATPTSTPVGEKQIPVEPKAGNKPAAPAKPAEELKTNLESVLNAETPQKAATALLKLKDSDVNGKEKDVLGKLLGIDSTKITTKIRSITIENGIITVVPKAAQTIKFSNETISFKDKSSPIKIEIPYKEMTQRPILQAYIKGLQN